MRKSFGAVWRVAAAPCESAQFVFTEQ